MIKKKCIIGFLLSGLVLITGVTFAQASNATYNFTMINDGGTGATIHPTTGVISGTAQSGTVVINVKRFENDFYAKAEKNIGIVVNAKTSPIKIKKRVDEYCEAFFSIDPSDPTGYLTISDESYYTIDGIKETNVIVPVSGLRSKIGTYWRNPKEVFFDVNIGKPGAATLVATVNRKETRKYKADKQTMSFNYKRYYEFDFNKFIYYEDKTPLSWKDSISPLSPPRKDTSQKKEFPTDTGGLHYEIFKDDDGTNATVNKTTGVISGATKGGDIRLKLTIPSSDRYCESSTVIKVTLT